MSIKIRLLTAATFLSGRVRVLTLEELWSGIRGTAAECVQFCSYRELITKPKVGNLNIHICIQ